MLPDKAFAALPTVPSTQANIENMRRALSTIKRLLLDYSSTSREQSIALTELETAGLWIVKAIASHPTSATS